MLNGSGALGPEPGLRSRGLLAVDLLEAGSAEAAEDCVLETPPETVRPCHVLIAGPAGVTAFSHPDAAGGSGVWSRRSVEAPISMWTAHGENAPASPRVAAHLADIRELGARWRERGDIRACLDSLEGLMARPAPPGAPRMAALGVPVGAEGFGTVSTSILAFPRAGAGRPILGRIADGPPASSRFRRLSLQVD
jgi:hypothetical protein